MRIAIIGTAGRDKTKPMSRELYAKMFGKIKEFHKANLLSEKEIIWVSGGAAWADHLAVTAWKYYGGKLRLHLPAELTESGFLETKDGGVANYYHRLFGAKMDGDPSSTLRSLYALKKEPAVEMFVYKGFLARNREVAKDCDFAIAFTWGEGDAPRDGGTLHTWRMIPSPKIHYPIGSL